MFIVIIYIYRRSGSKYAYIRMSTANTTIRQETVESVNIRQNVYYTYHSILYTLIYICQQHMQVYTTNSNNSTNTSTSKNELLYRLGSLLLKMREANIPTTLYYIPQLSPSMVYNIDAIIQVMPECIKLTSELLLEYILSINSTNTNTTNTTNKTTNTTNTTNNTTTITNNTNLLSNTHINTTTAATAVLVLVDKQEYPLLVLLLLEYIECLLLIIHTSQRHLVTSMKEHVLTWIM